MDNLRLILIVLGLIILAAIVLLHKPKGQSKPNHARWRESRREPRLDSTDAAGGAEESDEDLTLDTSALVSQASFPAFNKTGERGQSGGDGEGDASGAPRADAARRTPASALQHDKIITLYIRRRQQRRIGGSDLLDAAVKAGLSFGEMNIFHRRQEGVDQAVFSMANLTPPGHFDASAWNLFDTPGVALFATLPGPVSALDAWDAMLAAGSRIAELLEADLLDDAKCLLTRQRISQIREEMREYDRVHGLRGIS